MSLTINFCHHELKPYFLTRSDKTLLTMVLEISPYKILPYNFDRSLKNSEKCLVVSAACHHSAPTF